MFDFVYFFLKLVIILNFIQRNNCDNCFRVAVYEHVRINDPIDQPLKQLNNNFAIVEKVIQKASYENVKLIVLPEYVLHRAFDKMTILTAGISPVVPSLNTNLCTLYESKLKKLNNDYISIKERKERVMKLENTETEKIGEKVLKNIAILRKFSCLSAKYKISIALNLNTIERNESKDSSNEKSANTTQDNYDLFNTDLVFDSKGKLIAKYRKSHLFGESQVISPQKFDEVAFENEYGKFGIAICADILFEQPIKYLVEKKHIDHLIFSTSWYDPEFPLLAALNFHSASAAKYGINIISANQRNLPKGSFGSGIYDAKNGVKIQSKFNDYDRLLISELPIGNNSHNKQCNHIQRERVGPEIYKEYSYVLNENIHEKNYKRLKVPFEKFESIRLERTSGLLNVCYNQTCCLLDFQMNEHFNFEANDYYNYYLLAFSGTQNSQDPNVSWYEEICALVLYDEKTKNYKLKSSIHFDKFNLNAKFNATVTYSNLLTSDLEIIPRNKWSFEQQENFAEISFKKLKTPIISATVYARNFDLDPIKTSYHEQIHEA